MGIPANRHFKAAASLAAACALLVAGCGGGGGSSGDEPATTGIYLNVFPPQTYAGDVVRVSWGATDATRCWATGAWGGNAETVGEAYFEFPSAGSFEFVLTCEGFAGRETVTKTLEVTGAGVRTRMRADSTIVPAGSSATITWTSNGESCEAFEDWSGTRAASGSETVAIAEGYNFFVLGCTESTDTTYDFVVIRGQVTTIDFEAAPTVVGAGFPTDLRWFSWDADSCTATNAWNGSKERAGTEEVVPSALGDNVYTLTCEGPGAPAAGSVTVSAVLPQVKLRAFPRQAAVGETYLIEWSVPTAVSCTGSGAWSGAHPVEGSVLYTATETGSLEYTLTCANAGGTGEASDTVTVTMPGSVWPKASTYQINPAHTGATVFPSELAFPDTYAWRKTFAKWISHPIVADGRVFVTSAHDSMLGGQLHALALDTGEMLWGPIALGGAWGISHATYEDGQVFVLNSDGLLASFDAATGAPGWTLPLHILEGSSNCMFDAPPTAIGGIVFAGGCGHLSAVDQATGELIWEQRVDYGFNSAPAVSSTGVYVVYPCQTYGFAPTTGRPLWHIDNGCSGGGGSTAVVSGGIVYASDEHQMPYDTVYFLDASSGELLGDVTGLGMPAVTASQLFITRSGAVEAFSHAGASQWSFRAEGILDIEATPIVINDRVITGRSQDVFALDAATGEVKWTANAGGFIRRSEEQSIGHPYHGFSAAEGYLLVPAENVLTVWKIVP